MTEVGFASIDIFPLQVKKDDQLVLIRIPRSISLKDLHGKKVDMKKTGKAAVKGDHADAQVLFEFSESDAADNIYRPIISNLIDGSARLGPKFSSSIVVRDGTVELPSIAASDADELPLEFAYNPKPQLTGMRVHSLPIGSKSVLPQKSISKSTIAPQVNNDEVNEHKRKRSAAEDSDIVNEEKSSKKKKKKQDK